jgi:membrane protein required for colicin V production
LAGVGSNRRMNGIDLALLVVLALCAVRGYWRGLFREVFGVLGLLGGIAAAVEFAAPAAAALQQYLRLPTPLELGLAFVAIFVLVDMGLNLLAALLDRLAGALFLRGISRLAGAAVAAAKGAVVAAFTLLFLHLFPLFPALDQPIMNSAIGRPLVAAASAVVRLGSQPSGAPQSSRNT